MLLTCLEKYLLLQVKDLHRMNCRCQMQLIQVGEHMNRQDKIWIDEGSRKVFFSKYLNSELSINFSKILLPLQYLVMIQVYNWINCLLPFLWIGTILAFSIRLESTRFLKLENKGFDIEEAHNFNMWI